MIRNAIDESLAKMELDQSGRTKILNRIRELENSAERRDLRSVGRRRRPLRLLVAVLVLILGFSALCIAAELPAKLMDLFEPVNETVVYDGVELKVVRAVADEDSVMILYTLRDLQGDRISESTSIRDFNLSRASSVGSFPVDYDAETKTKTFCMAGDNGSEMKGRKLTLSVSSFLSETPIRLYATSLDLQEFLGLQNEDVSGLGFEVRHAPEDGYRWNWAGQNGKGAELRESFDKSKEAYVLPEGDLDLEIPGVDWATITNIGYRDGWLHVRVKYDAEKSEIDHGYICLCDSEGNQLDNAILRTPFSEGGEEFILRVDRAEERKDVYLAGFFTNYDSLHTGEWNATFQVKGVETKSFACEVETESVTINGVALSPLGVSVSGKGGLDDSDRTYLEDGVRIYLRDGTFLDSEGFSRMGDGETGVFTCKYKFAVPLEIQEVDRIELAGRTVEVPD